jgi:hypothetical protein
MKHLDFCAFNYLLKGFFYLPFIGLISISNLQAQHSILFNSDQPLEIIVHVDIKKLIKSNAEDEFLEGQITIDRKTSPIRLKPRSNYLKESCSFPPVSFNFSKTEFDDQSLNQLGKMKQVNACELQKTYEQYILREYLIYRAFNLLSDKSLKVRLLKIDYVDQKGKAETVTRWGFVLENQYQMASRLEGVMVKSERIDEKNTNRQQMVMLAIFQFMIGNTDWQVSKLHNIYLLKLLTDTKAEPYAIPFDFDYTGMVNAAYATPSPVLGIESFRERLFWGKCYSRQELQNAIDVFIEKKEALYELYRNFEQFDETSLNESITFLDSFYDIIEDASKWENFFVDNCRE